MVDHGNDLKVSSWKEDQITIMQSAVMTLWMLAFSVIHLATTLKEVHRTSINKLSFMNIATSAWG